MNTENNINEKEVTAAESAKKNAAKSGKKNIYQKLLAIQTALKAPKDLFNKFGKYYYRNAESILEAVKPFLTKQECVLLLKDDIEVIGSTVNSQTDEKGVKTVKEMARRYVKATATLIDCVTGDRIETYAYANECEHTGMSGDQCTGTASSYARKYCLNALFLLDDTKDSDTDEMKNIENSAEQQSAAQKQQAAPQNNAWGKPNAAPPKQNAPANAAPAQTAGQQPQRSGNGWGKPKSANGWGNKA